MPDPVSVLVLVLTAVVLCLLLPFASHRTYLLWLSRRPRPAEAREWRGPLPPVTVQLPVYNERAVVGRLLNAACSQDYPRHLLQVQLLDDSTDDTVRVAAEKVAEWRARGVDVVHVRRVRRTGFKAGALEGGMETCTGRFVLVLDADFVPGPDLIRRLLPPFQDPGVGMVQARWDHLNEHDNGLTRAQALLLDGHFFFEHGARYAAGRFFNFNGTAGMWRVRCLREAGGWRADTLTEDLDLSYRAQMAGWRFVYLDRVGVPAELPATVGALEVQQRRWAQGGIQTARKLLPSLLRGAFPAPVKAEGAIHLLGHLAQPLTLALGVLLFPSAVARRGLGLESWLWLDLVALALATVPFVVFYGAAGRRRGRPWLTLAPRVLGVLSLGIGLSASLSRSVLRGLGTASDPFLRTPKRGGGRRWLYRHGSSPRDAAVKGFMAVLAVVYLAAAVVGGYWGTVPFLALFASGYLRVSLGAGFSRLQPPGSGQMVLQQERQRRDPDKGPGPRRLRPAARVVVGG